MKYSGKIAGFIKQRKIVRVCDFKGVQWIGDGAVLYPILGMRTLDDKELVHFLDLDPNDIEVRHTVKLSIDLSDDTIDETFINDRGQDVVFNGELCRTYYTERGALFFAGKYFAPVEKDKSLDLPTDVYLRVCEHNSKQFPYIVLKKGIYVFAAILPIDTWSRDAAVKNFWKLAEQTKLARMNFAFYDPLDEENSRDEDEDDEGEDEVEE